MFTNNPSCLNNFFQRHKEKIILTNQINAAAAPLGSIACIATAAAYQWTPTEFALLLTGASTLGVSAAGSWMYLLGLINNVSCFGAHSVPEASPPQP
jgi:hypothetical protein